MPICKERWMPFVAPFSGAALLRPTPPDPLVFHLRAGYNEEIGAMVDALLDHAGLALGDIAFFTQRDAYGDAGFAGGIAAFKRRDAPASLRPLHVRYERNTLDVEAALADCLLAVPQPRAVIMVGAYAPCARFIRMARESGFDPLFLNVSFVGAESLAKDLGNGKEGDGVIITEVVPTLDRQTTASKEFTAALAALPEETRVEPCLGAFEGYLAGRMACLALRKCPAPPTPACVASALEGLGSFDLGLGAPLELDPKNHQACHSVWPSIIRAGRVVTFDWTELQSTRK
jgi:ABC-type branched-subunit amino acid transport system substrate-binding protein